jgi:Lrp/AsnC family transcriptional regulator, regulator for asnA, asnC and gidA
VGKGQIQMDAIDKTIIKYLQIDGRKSYTDIAEELGVTVGTVRNRVQRLIENGILKIVAVVDPIKTGMSTVAMVGLKVRLNKLQDVIEELVKIPEVRLVAASTGMFDLFLQIITFSIEDYYRIISENMSTIEGIEDSHSFMLLQINKQTYDWGVK